MRDLASFIDRLAKRRAGDIENEKDGWQWKRRTFLYRNPEFFCPRCKTWDETHLIWLVDEERYQLLGVWNLDGTNAYSQFTHVHPHVSGSNICKGTSTSAAAALFASIHPDNPYHDINTWLREIGHMERCSFFPKVKCGWCLETYSDVHMFSFGQTSIKVCKGKGCHQKASEIKCFGCFNDRDPSQDERRGLYCEKCFEERAATCFICSEKWNYNFCRSFRAERVCPTCAAVKKRKCKDCAKFFIINELDSQGRCDLKCHHVYCNYCGGTTRRGDIDGRGYCLKCSEAAKSKCPRCKTNEATMRGWCDSCDWQCGCDSCNCSQGVEVEGFVCDACLEGDHD